MSAHVIEVGLGGRLDATNIVTPKISAITSLSYDHMAVLGDTLAKIAGEKAGIIKQGVPVVSSPQKDEALEVWEHVANSKESTLILVGRDVNFGRLGASLDSQTLYLYSSTSSSKMMVTIPLLGEHQVENAATAYAALKASGIELPDESIQKGFSQVKWRARFEVARLDPPVFFDSAHNQYSFTKLCQTLDEYFPDQPVYLIFGASAGKTTLFNVVTGFLPPTYGEVFFNGENITGLRPDQVARRGLVRTFQIANLFKHKTVLENLVIAHHLRVKSGLPGSF